MRKLSPWAIRSRGRDQHRERYATYMSSAAWFSRRDTWAEQEAAQVGGADKILCTGGCGQHWEVRKDDLHHCTYDRLGNEAHEDLWPMCRDCHTRLHDLMVSTRSWRKLPKQQANAQALQVVRASHNPVEPRSNVSKLWDAL